MVYLLSILMKTALEIICSILYYSPTTVVSVQEITLVLSALKCAGINEATSCYLGQCTGSSGAGKR